ncbi:hypothetical protein Droror1_Dr00025756 [Drosera rotundifolia]
MAGAAGGFVTRAFESMLKECSGKKYTALQAAIQAYLDNAKGGGLAAAVVGTGEEKSATEVVKPETDIDQSPENKSEEVKQAGKPLGTGGIAAALASAGHILEGSESELILNPLRLAFETKNVKIIELALDCLHKLIAYDHLEGDPGLEGGKNVPLFTDVLNMVCSCVDNSSPDSTILQVLKVLLTAVASTRFRVHGEALLMVIRVSYNIALNSKSPMNQATSKAMLTQMINIIFRRMEFDLNSSTDPKGGLDESSSGSASQTEETFIIGSASNMKDTLTDQNQSEMTVGDELNQVAGASLASVEELQTLAGGTDIKGLEAVLDKAVHLEDKGKIKHGMELDSMTIGQRDAVLLFRTLCKMGMKEDTDEITTKTRILSLELLQGSLEGVTYSFTKNLNFIDSVKAHLCYTLLRACVSPSPAIFQYAAGTFAVLLLRFRESLKSEIGIFFPLIVLRTLDGAESPLSQRISVLRMLEKVCKDPQMLVDIYVNYDCDLDAANLFERMVTTLSKIAQGTQTTDPNSVTASQNASVKGSSLQCLVSMLKSLVDWERSHSIIAMESKSKQSPNDGLSVEASVLESREDTPNDFKKAKAHKSTLEAAIAEFNRQPVKGIEYLISNKLVENSPAAIADFLKNMSTLDKSMIGDYLGQHEEFPLAVMHSYVDSMDFSGMKFGAAIRNFLSGFRLPGEAQKIDRIMEKFAERYCADNPDLFKNADTAYILAYAVIMLNTDAHNPMVWPKMSKAEFVRMNSGNDAEESPPKELLEEIYDSIVKEEIKIKADVDSFGKSSGQKPEAEDRGRLVSILNLALPKRKSSIEVKSENEAIIKQTRAIFRNQGAKRGIFYTTQKVELVRPMVEAVGWPLLATFSVIMEEGENKPKVLLCMEGFRAGIHITHVLGMDTMRYAFLTSLVRFTFLHAPKEMRSKNVEALRNLLAICDTDVDSLQDTWNAVLECISRLEFITSNPSISATVMLGSNQISRDALLQSLRELAGKPAEQVFLNSASLPSDAVVEFFNALCGVSAEELKQKPARVFSLQKLVEISYYNMARIRMVWARIWSVLANHFISAGSHHDDKIAMYAIDSLRQLGMKYLERAELNNFTFQNDILKPFVVLMRNSRNDQLRRLIVDCIIQMIKSKAGSIKSGWRSVFMIFTAAADDESESIVESAFENVEQVILEHFDQVVGDCFMDCVNCLIGFANNKSSSRISLKAIALLRICEDRLAEGLVPGGFLKPIDIGLDASFDMTEHYWFPMLAGLSELTSDPRAEVRNCALEVLFDLLNEKGSKFSSSFWEIIFRRVLFPIFDHAIHADDETLTISSHDEWLRETLVHSLQLLCNLFNTFYKEVSFMLPSLLTLLLDCAKKTEQSVVSISLGALVHLIEVGGHQFSYSDWDKLLDSIRDAAHTTQPVELLNDLVFGFSNTTTLIGESEAENVDGVTARSTNIGSHHNTQSDMSSLNDNPYAVGWSSIATSEGSVSPSIRSQKRTETGELQRTQTMGQRIMGNVMDNIFFRNSSKSKNPEVDTSSHSQFQLPDDAENKSNEEVESPLLRNIRGKCITQLLLLGAVDSIQKKYWPKLNTDQRVTVMEISLSILEFAASYNSYTNLRLRMHHGPTERPPLNLLRQEFAGTCVYLEILHKSTSVLDSANMNQVGIDASQDTDKISVENHSNIKHSDQKRQFDRIAEEKLVTFCSHVLKEASEFQSTMGDSTNMEVHRVVELRSPIIVKVIRGMSSMNNYIFRKHLKEFYPLVTKLVCCDQMEVRGAIGDLFSGQLTPLLV